MTNICFDVNVASILKHLRYNGLLPPDAIVLNLNENFSIGLLEPLNPSFRRKELERLGTQVDIDFDKLYVEFFSEVKKFREKTWYLWCSNNPHELMGVHFVAAYFGSIQPSFVVCDSAKLLSCFLTKGNPKDYQSIIHRAEKVSTADYANLWNECVEEKSELRIGISGKIQPVPISFFDSWIENAIATSSENASDFDIAARVYQKYRTVYQGEFSINYFLYRVQAIRK